MDVVVMCVQLFVVQCPDTTAHKKLSQAGNVWIIRLFIKPCHERSLFDK